MIIAKAYWTCRERRFLSGSWRVISIVIVMGIRTKRLDNWLVGRYRVAVRGGRNGGPRSREPSDLI
jgi:hypothetical protein